MPIYRLLRRDPTEIENESDNQQRQSDNPRARVIIILCSIIAALLCLNGLLFLYFSRRSGSHNSSCRSSYAHLERNLSIQIYQSTPYVSDNLSSVAHLWESLSGDPGVVALPQAFVSETHLPRAMRFPWDHDKGVYLLQGFHNLHCLRTLFRYAWTSEQRLPQRIAFSHILHCLDQLRQDVLCNADDTPRYAGFQSPPGTGAGQVRLCRDWEQLERWAVERSACFRHEDETPGRLVDRFKFCPGGEGLWSTRGDAD
ncbi:hypothetical protein P170DRAFT_506552 [Aspergillus steynii IBT 23096]|uniref:Tat pathway signal sequence n=1 Tax=Aspergillus steynii IBT 23096 TaxID=1392250 RepID=A0A2I2GFD4_9EURO|nr:uncharacterized protein P170DRAFT_506552 [Aspergillus steynii IBT 23096]PLB51571.1 hypothetical protein P170DRAFT_506552 [Aspergillus steynii IBT 23096]